MRLPAECEKHCGFIGSIIFSRFRRAERAFYVSFKDETGEWLEPVKINERLEGVCPLISQEGKFFFFNSDGIYWMPADFIFELKPKK